MTKHKTEDYYKKSAVKYYLNNDRGDRYKKTCKIFDCKKSTLRDCVSIGIIEEKRITYYE